MTTIENTTIEALHDSAAAAGDILMAAICRRALGDSFENYALTDAERARVDAMSEGEAMVEVREALASAAAMRE